MFGVKVDDTPNFLILFIEAIAQGIETNSWPHAPSYTLTSFRTLHAKIRPFRSIFDHLGIKDNQGTPEVWTEHWLPDQNDWFKSLINIFHPLILDWSNFSTRCSSIILAIMYSLESQYRRWFPCLIWYMASLESKVTYCTWESCLFCEFR